MSFKLAFYFVLLKIGKSRGMADLKKFYVNAFQPPRHVIKYFMQKCHSRTQNLNICKCITFNLFWKLFWKLYCMHSTVYIIFNMAWRYKQWSSSNPCPCPTVPGNITYLGAISDPCCMRLPQLCQKQLCRVSTFSSSSGSSTHGWGFSHS